MSAWLMLGYTSTLVHPIAPYHTTLLSNNILVVLINLASSCVLRLHWPCYAFRSQGMEHLTAFWVC